MVVDYMTNKTRMLYESIEEVKFYSQNREIDKPEYTLLKEFSHLFSYMKMLDIGVGAGRTTHIFAPLVKEYIGIDYSKNMINYCNQKVKDLYPNTKFLWSDATCLDQFSDNTFDFTLFSFNGIDDNTHDYRLKILKEIKRVTKDTGFFFFSTHNLSILPELYKIKFDQNPVQFVLNIAGWFLILAMNGTLKSNIQKDYAYIWRRFTYSSRYHDHTYYIKPEYQVKQLEEIGFTHVRIFSALTGKEIPFIKDAKQLPDYCLSYLCKAS